MNRDLVTGRLQQSLGIIAEYWGDVTGAQFITIIGRKARRAGRIRAQLGLSTAQADRQLREFHHRHRHWKITA